MKVVSTYWTQDQNWAKEMRIACLQYVIVVLILKYGRRLNFVPHLKGLRNIDTDFNLTCHIASVILIFTNQELNKI